MLRRPSATRRSAIVWKTVHIRQRRQESVWAFSLQPIMMQSSGRQWLKSWRDERRRSRKTNDTSTYCEREIHLRICLMRYLTGYDNVQQCLTRLRGDEAKSYL